MDFSDFDGFEFPLRRKLGNIRYSVFKKQIEPTASGCWIWHGYVTSNGYPRFNHPSEETGNIVQLSASRLCYEFFSAKDLGSKRLRNTCGNKACVNHRHWGLCGEVIVPTNARKGSGHEKSKLTESKVTEIRFLYSRGLTYKKLAEDYGVSFGLIRSVVKKTAWRHVD